MKKVIFLLTFVLAFFSCKEEKETKSNIDSFLEEKKSEGVKLYALDGGTVQVNMLGIFSQDTTYTGQTKTFADAFYIIEHPKGRLLWDAGLGEGLVGQEPFTTPEGAFTVSRKDSVVSQLREISLKPEEIDFIGLSHTHFDHTGSASKFSKSIWLVQEAEYDFITSKEQKQTDNYKAIENLEKVQKINGDYDVFGDGKVIIKAMPGHTPGHQVLFLKLENAGNILLTGDLYHFQENRTSRGVPSFNYDVDMTLKSMVAFEAFAKENNADVYIQHSQKDFDRLPKYPNYLD